MKHVENFRVKISKKPGNIVYFEVSQKFRSKELGEN